METLTRSQRAGIVAALAALLLVGGLIARAAGAGDPAPVPTVAHVSRALIGVRAADAPTATDTPSPTATAAEAPTPTAGSTPTVAPTPTATSAPATPTDTPTPAPTWHTVASYSGSMAGTLGMVTHSGPMRVLYTCTVTESDPSWYFNVVFSNGSGGQFSNGATCQAGATSGTLDFSGAGSGTDTVSLSANPVESFTLTVQVYS